MFTVQNALYYAFAVRRPATHVLRAGLCTGWWALMMTVATGGMNSTLYKYYVNILKARKTPACHAASATPLTLPPPLLSPPRAAAGLRHPLFHCQPAQGAVCKDAELAVHPRVPPGQDERGVEEGVPAARAAGAARAAVRRDGRREHPRRVRARARQAGRTSPAPRCPVRLPLTPAATPAPPGCRPFAASWAIVTRAHTLRPQRFSACAACSGRRMQRRPPRQAQRPAAAVSRPARSPRRRRQRARSTAAVRGAACATW